MDHFILHSEYIPIGDQPQAIEELATGFREGNQFQTLLGVTGSGKTFTMANVIAKLNLPTIVISHNQTLAAKIYGEFKELKEIITVDVYGDNREIIAEKIPELEEFIREVAPMDGGMWGNDNTDIMPRIEEYV